MPAKKTTSTATVKKAVEKAPVKKVAEKKEEAKKVVTKKAPVKKEAEPKKVVKKETVKKAAPKTTKAPAKKAPVKKEAAPKKAAKKTVKTYEDIINWKKGEAHAMDWLYIEINAGDLLTEVEAGVDNISAACNAILNCMLEGDGFIVEPTEANKVNSSLTVRYYCDNLSDSRKKFFAR